MLLLGVLAAGLLLGRPGHGEGLIPSGWVARSVGGDGFGATLFAPGDRVLTPKLYTGLSELLELLDEIMVPGAHGAAMSSNGKYFYTTNLPGGGAGATQAGRGLRARARAISTAQAASTSNTRGISRVIACSSVSGRRMDKLRRRAAQSPPRSRRRSSRG